MEYVEQHKHLLMRQSDQCFLSGFTGFKRFCMKFDQTPSVEFLSCQFDELVFHLSWGLEDSCSHCCQCQSHTHISFSLSTTKAIHKSQRAWLPNSGWGHSSPPNTLIYMYCMYILRLLEGTKSGNKQFKTMTVCDILDRKYCMRSRWDVAMIHTILEDYRRGFWNKCWPALTTQWLFVGRHPGHTALRSARVMS